MVLIMKGVIFTELFNLVENLKDADFVDDLIEECNLPSGGAYTSVGTYDYAEMQTLVFALAEKTGLPVPALMEAFGRFLFSRFHVLYPALFAGHSCPIEFLAQIEAVIHKEVLKLYPEAQLPSFDILEHSSTTITLQYKSCRGLAPLALGLIQGCIAHFQKSGEADVVFVNEDNNEAVFRIRVTE